MISHLVKRILHRRGYTVTRTPELPAFAKNIPDASFYTPLFSPWLGHGAFAAPLAAASKHTLVSADRCYVLFTLAAQALHLDGEFWECGVYRGGTAHLLADAIAASAQPGKPLRLFDTFAGMPETDARHDFHSKGDFADTSLAAVRKRIGPREHVHYHQGWIPATFSGLESSRIALAHIDVDIYQSVLDSIAFISPRLVPGGFVVFDDYGFPTCPGARQAVDEFYARRREKPLVLPTGQAIVFNSFGG
ncbi:MAG TPA: TylF/MycF/NovP-related O-methyltransferase [Ramlibacter sp.]|nr:TylF/MycF/NovP-related O-methyltransferase [Ramlibacter sp.]